MTVDEFLDDLRLYCQAESMAEYEMLKASRPPIHVPPVERDEGLGIDRAAPTPSQPVDERDAPPRGPHEVRGVHPEGDVDAGGGAATVGTEGVRRGRPPLAG